MSRPEYLDRILNKEILEQSYIELGSLKAVARKFEVDPGSIKKYMKRYNLDFKPQIRYDCDHEFFSRDNEESFYIAGFIAADGCVKEKKNSSGNICYQLQIGLSKEDKDFLIHIRDTLKSNNPVSDFLIKNSKRNPKWNDTWKSEFTIVSKQMYNDLSRFNIVPRKSLIYKFPEWMKNHTLKHHFIRGYNDGDGSFYIPKPKERRAEQVYFSMRGTPEFLTDVRTILEQECDLEVRCKEIRISSGHGCLEYGGNHVIKKISSFLYDEATIMLSRKLETVIKVLGDQDVKYNSSDDIVHRK